MGFPVSLQIALQAHGKYERLIDTAEPFVLMWLPRSRESR